MLIDSFIHISIILLFFPTFTTGFPWSNHHHHRHDVDERTTSDQCCVSSKLNVASKKANNGREFFRQLSSQADSYTAINPDNVCNLVHFFIQQASLNNQSISFTKGMFVLFDATNQIFNQFMRAKDEQKSGDEAKYSGYFNRLKHMGKQAISDLFKKGPKESDTFIYVRGDESSHYHDERGSKDDRKSAYPAYGMDIPGACKSFLHQKTMNLFCFPGMPSGFGHVLFGKLPPVKESGKYAGERIYFKPELFGIRHLEQFIQHAQSYLEHVSRRYVCQIKDIQKLPGCSSEEAFRENTDKKLLKQWNEILVTIPDINHQQLIENAERYGIHEIYQQAKDLQENDQVKTFLKKITEQYGNDDISVRKGREIIYTVEQLKQSPLTCEFLSSMKKC